MTCHDYNHCLLTSSRITRFIAAFDASSPFDDPGSSSFEGAAVVVAEVVVVFVFLRVCARRLVVGLFSFGIAIEPPGTFGIASFTDGIDVAAPPDGRAGATALTFEAIHAK